MREPRAARQLLIDASAQADVVRVYSPALQEKLSAYNPQRDAWSADRSIGRLMPTAGAAPGSARQSGSSTRRAAAGSVGQMLIAPLQRVLDRHPQTELTIWGPRHDGAAAHPQVRILPLIRDYDRFFARFAREAFDIGLAPLPDENSIAARATTSSASMPPAAWPASIRTCRSTTRRSSHGEHRACSWRRATARGTRRSSV